MLTCKKIVEQSSEYLEGNMTLPQRMNYKLHLLLCWHCRRYLRHFKTTVIVASQCAKKVLPEAEAEMISSTCEKHSHGGAAAAPKHD